MFPTPVGIPGTKVCGVLGTKTREMQKKKNKKTTKKTPSVKVARRGPGTRRLNKIYRRKPQGRNSHA